MATNVRGSPTFVWDTSKPLGQGATSMVYMGRNKKTGDEVAVKVFNSQSYQRPFSVQRREFEVMQKLSHENIVKLLAIEEESPSRAKVIVMEFCTHGTLYNLLDMAENNFGLAEEEFLRVLAQVTAGVKHLRDNKIIHRDIKPGNILRSVREDGRSVFKLTDFGAARELEQDEEFLSLYGTDEYLHPDMYERAVLRKSRGKQFGVYVDLWSLGVTFYHAATGSLPFRPFGGRKNRETMHQITAKKEHDVISGVQDTHGGPIRWSKDLPPTCRLSRGLKSLITPCLAKLLEKDQNLTMTFDDFFLRVDDIASRTPYYAFCPSSFSLLTLYARGRDDMSQLRQLITDQTDIPGGAQLLMVDGKELKDESREPVSSYLPHVSPEHPIFVFNKLPEFKRFIKPAVGKFPDIPPETMVDTDYPLSKKCYAVLHSVRNAVKVILQCNNLMNMAVKMYSNHIQHKSLEMELSMGHVMRGCSDARSWKEHLFSSLNTQATLLKALSNSNVKPPGLDVMGRANMLQTIYQTGNRECTQVSTSIHSKLDKAVSMLENIKVGQTADAGWDPSVGCMPSDRCIEKMDVLISKMHKVVLSFKEDRSRRALNNNDEQIHRFDKNKLKELCITARTLVEDHCVNRASMLFEAYKQFYSKVVQIHDSGERLDALVIDIYKQQKRLCDKLKVSGKQCAAQTESCLSALGQTEPVTNGEVSNHGDNGTASSLGTRQERLDGVLDGLQLTRSSLEEVRALLDENTSLMERFSSLQDQDQGEDDKSWEYVPYQEQNAR
ncbi:serine/threonine-protein kinase TBK1 [Aplysia californica]|uniref:Serine/threonine-protein kinase TBK1 n=1 Tax=Aplysia californica TaxID=6500 RepID=A0ABM0JGE4_APLCA|nr:serine/threonine-protein kinase TBK1 [Aplysia californica]